MLSTQIQKRQLAQTLASTQCSRISLNATQSLKLCPPL